MQLKRVLDLILLQLLEHFLKEPGFTELAFDPMSNSSRLVQSPPEVDLTIPKVQNYSNFQMVPSHGKKGSNSDKVKDLFEIKDTSQFLRESPCWPWDHILRCQVSRDNLLEK
jgi:hypothetical protein